MDLTTLLGTTFDCACGRRHHIPTEKLFYGRDAFATFAQTAAEITDGQHYLVVADQRTREKAGEKVAVQLATSGRKISSFIIPDKAGEEPTADDMTKDYFMEHAAFGRFVYLRW